MFPLKRLAQLGVTAAAATALIVGFSANAEAARGTLTLRYPNGNTINVTDRGNFICFPIQGAVGAVNRTDANAFFSTDASCSNTTVVVPPGGSADFSPQNGLVFRPVGDASGQDQSHT
ncbi:hypothetical protein [Streptomyces hiroshimensis]|uniref:Uncharacterized protein n=1 Tax=Streptomyces hiroshimensis TaxID=66424 RepID=A0ABQ2YWG6_9ACTN|nr:hypothetical protein [Streptomyces hiroshimensis]GGX97592.1 hypothetical protein GCM10010324_49750 [Streptomyces hiroshimensis]